MKFYSSKKTHTDNGFELKSYLKLVFPKKKGKKKKFDREVTGPFGECSRKKIQTRKFQGDKEAARLQASGQRKVKWRIRNIMKALSWS